MIWIWWRVERAWLLAIWRGVLKRINKINPVSRTYPHDQPQRDASSTTTSRTCHVSFSLGTEWLWCWRPISVFRWGFLCLICLLLYNWRGPSSSLTSWIYTGILTPWNEVKGAANRRKDSALPRLVWLDTFSTLIGLWISSTWHYFVHSLLFPSTHN